LFLAKSKSGFGSKNLQFSFLSLLHIVTKACLLYEISIKFSIFFPILNTVYPTREKDSLSEGPFLNFGIQKPV
jgi:hypothetical protein